VVHYNRNEIKMSGGEKAGYRLESNLLTNVGSVTTPIQAHLGYCVTPSNYELLPQAFEINSY
jgi:hypothetical protein